MKRLHNFEYLTHRKELFLYGIALLLLAISEIVSTYSRAYTVNSFTECANKHISEYGKNHLGGLSSSTSLLQIIKPCRDSGSEVGI